MKKIQVRIALAVDPKGKVAAEVIPKGKSWRTVDYILDWLGYGALRYIITAEVAVPSRHGDIREVAAKVEDAQ